MSDMSYLVGRPLVPFFPEDQPTAPVEYDASSLNGVEVRRWNPEGYFEAPTTVKPSVKPASSAAPTPVPTVPMPAAGTSGIAMSPDQLFALARAVRTTTPVVAARAPVTPPPPALPREPMTPTALLLTPSQLAAQAASPQPIAASPPQPTAAVPPSSPDMSAAARPPGGSADKSAKKPKQQQQQQQQQKAKSASGAGAGAVAATTGSADVSPARAPKEPKSKSAKKAPPLPSAADATSAPREKSASPDKAGRTGRNRKPKSADSGVAPASEPVAGAAALPVARRPPAATPPASQRAQNSANSSVPTAAYAWSSFQASPDPKSLPLPPFIPAAAPTAPIVAVSVPTPAPAAAPAAASGPSTQFIEQDLRRILKLSS